MQGQEMLKQAGYFEDGETVTGNSEVTPDEAKFRVGDVVRLRSGGPEMTVTHVPGTYIVVSYFSDRDGFKTDRFPPECLMPTIASA